MLLLLHVRRQRVHRQAGLLPERVTAERTVLFVCVENAARSLLAEAILNANAPRGWVAESAGTRPAAAPNPRTGRFLGELGLALPDHPPSLLTELQARRASVVITMGCQDDRSCPALLGIPETRDWALPDPATLDDAGFRLVREEIRRRVDLLCAELAPSADAVPGKRPP
jgi:arsenate reductase